MLEYKGYTAHVELDTEAAIFHGEVLDTRESSPFKVRVSTRSRKRSASPLTITWISAPNVGRTQINLSRDVLWHLDGAERQRGFGVLRGACGKSDAAL
jgi:hypothetical protein